MITKVHKTMFAMKMYHLISLIASITIIVIGVFIIFYSKNLADKTDGKYVLIAGIFGFLYRSAVYYFFKKKQRELING